METMKAVRLVKVGAALEEQAIPIPQVGAHDVLVEVKAAGICHSDAHYRAGVSPVDPLPLTLGHEVAGVVMAKGEAVHTLDVGDRVCLHYMVTCGHCEYCFQGSEQFCTSGKMLGKYTDGGYAETIIVPARSAFRLPEEIPFEHGAALMCSSATSNHALIKSGLRGGETLAIYGAGGLGISATQLGGAYGARTIYAVDIRADKLALAASYGAIPIDATQGDPVAQIRDLTGGRGVDVALELVGLPLTMRQSVQSLAVFGRAVIAGLTDKTMEIAPYAELLGREASLIGAADHLAREIPGLLEWARTGALDLSQVVTRSVPLEAGAINAVLDALDAFHADVRTVIVP